MAGIYDTINREINARRGTAGLVKANYVNPYELVYEQIKSNPFFTEQDWDKYKRRGELDGYLGILQSAEKNLNYDEVSNKYGFKWLDDDTRFDAIWNELNKNDLQESSMRYEERFNYDTQKYDKFEIGEMSEYEYNKLIVEQIKSAEVDKFKHQMAEDIKSNRSGFGKFLGTAFSTFILEPLSGATEQVDETFNLFAALGSGIESVSQGGRFDEGFASAYQQVDAYGDVISEAKVNGFQSLREAIEDFETQYSWMRDIDGSYTNYGKIAGGVATSLGKALPSILLNKIGGKFLEAGSKSLSNVAKASEILYYTGLGSGTFQDMVRDPSMVSVPTYQIMLNAAAKTTAEWVMQEGLSKAFGTTALDKMTFGQTGSKVFGGTTFAKVSKKVLLDAAHEGLEELSQDYSSYLLDQTFGLFANEKFGQQSEWNMQTAMDAFILGALSVVASSAFSIATTPRHSRGALVDDDGNIVTSKKGKVKQDYAGKFTSWIYRADIGTMTENFNKALEDKNLTKEQRQDAVGKMYAAMRTITSVYGEIGEARVTEAAALIREMQAAAAKFELTDDQIKETATKIYERAITVGKAYTEAQKNKVIDAMMKKGMTEQAAISERDGNIIGDIPQEIQDTVVQTITDLYKADPKLNKVLMTKDGTGPVLDDFTGTLFAPINYLINSDGHMVLETLAEEKLVESIDTTKNVTVQNVLKEVKRIFEQSTNRTDVDMSEIIYNVMFNDSFYRICLSTANAQMYQFLSHLDTIEKEATTDTEKNAVYKKKINAAKKNITIALAQWLVLQQDANYEDLTIFKTKKGQALKQWIAKNRYGKNLANRIIKGESLDTADVELLKTRVNGLPVDIDTKLDIMKGLGFNAEWNRTESTQNSRRNSLNTLNQTYADFFVTPFNGQKYMLSNSLQNNIFNEFLMANNLDLDGILKLKPKARKVAQEKFLDRTGGAWEFIVSKGQVLLKATRFQSEDSYREYQHERELIKSGRPRMNVIERTQVNVTDGRKYVDALIGNSVDAASKAFMNITDVIVNPTVLKKDIQQNIKDEYGKVTSYTTFLYLRDMTLEQTGTISIVARGDGTFTYVDIKEALDTLKDKNVLPEQIGEVEKGNIKRLMKLEFLPEGSRLEDITVVQTGNETFYDEDTNTIFIAKDVTGDYFRFALLHEFQHAVQAENNLNGGLYQHWLFSPVADGSMHWNMPKEQAVKLIAEVREHRPELFVNAVRKDNKGNDKVYPNVAKGTRVEAEIVQEFIYDTSGESQAMGTEGDTYIVDFYPTIVRRSGAGTEITLASGGKYQVGTDTLQSAEIETRVDPDTIYNGKSKEFKIGGYTISAVNFGKAVDAFAERDGVLTIERMRKNNRFKGLVFDGKIVSVKSDHWTTIEAIMVQAFANQYTDGNTNITAFDAYPDMYDAILNQSAFYPDTFSASIGMIRTEGYTYSAEVVYEGNRIDRLSATDAISKLEAAGKDVYICVGTQRGALKNYNSISSALTDLIRQDRISSQRTSFEISIDKTNPLFSNTWDGDINDVSDTQINEALSAVYTITYNGLREIYGDRVYLEDGEPRVRAERRGDMAVLYHGTNQTDFNMQMYREIKARNEADYVNLFVSTVPEFSLYYGSNLYEILVPWDKYTTLDNYKVEEDFENGFDFEVGRATEHAVQRVIDDIDTITDIKKIDRSKYDDTTLNVLSNAGQEGNPSFLERLNRQSLEPPKQPGPTRTRVTETKISDNVRLKPFKGKLLSNDLQTLIVEVDYAQLDPRVKQMIDDGTLNIQHINNIFRDTTKAINNYTFKLLNKYVYKNKFIKSISQLDNLTQIEAANYYAIREILKSQGALELLVEPRAYTEFLDMLRTLDKNDAIRKAFRKHKTLYEHSANGRALDINRGNIRVAFMRLFDGTIDTAGGIANLARKAAIAGVGQTTDVATTKSGITEVAKVVAADNDLFNDILSSTGRLDKEFTVKAYRLEKFKSENPDATYKQILKFDNEITQEIDELTDDALDQFIVEHLVAEITDRTEFITEKISNEVPTYTRKLESIQKNIARIARDFKNNISKREFDKLSPEIQAMFDENMRLKREYYDTRTYLEDDGKTIKQVGKTREQVLELEAQLRTLNKQARDGMLKNKTSAQITQQLERAKQKLAKERGRRLLAESKVVTNVKERVVVLNDREFDITSDVDIPANLREILDTTFDEFSKAETQYLTGSSELKLAVQNYVKLKDLTLSNEDIDVLLNALINTTVQGKGVITEDIFIKTIRNERNTARFSTLTDADASAIYKLYNEGIQNRIKNGDRNMQMNLKKFLEANGQRLSSLSQGDIDNIIEFYQSATLTGKMTRDNIRKFDAFQIYMLTYILKQSRQNVWKLTTDQITEIENKLELMASMAGTNLSVWRSAMEYVNPNKIIMQSIARASGVTLREADIETISKAMQSGDIKAVQDAQAEMLRNALTDNAGSKRSIWNKIWSFQRMAMLSGPGTLVRNHTSNALLTVSNEVGSWLGNLFFKKHRKQGQYIIAGTKVDNKTKAFIDDNFISNGFLDSIMDGLSKYDQRHTRLKTTGVDAAVDMIARAVETQVLNHRDETKNKALKAIQNIIMKGLSDDPWIKARTKSYFGKMLVEDKIDLTQGRTHEVLTTLSEAYTAACFDYMRKPNAITKMEAKLKEHGGDLAFLAYKQIFPFMSASWNWFTEGLRYTPLGLAKAIGDFAKLENTIDKMDTARLKGEHVMSSRFAEYLARRNIGKGIIGSIGLGIGILLGVLGVARIDDDDDKIKLVVGDASVDISGIFGTQGILLGMALTNPRGGEKYDFAKHMTDVLDTLANNSILDDMYNTFRFNKSTGEWLVDSPNRILGMFVPNFLKTMTSLTYNHEVQYTTGFLGRIERTLAQALPGIAYAFPKRIDPYTGETMSRFKIPFLIDFMNRMLPFKIKDNDMSDLEKGALELGVKKGELTGRYDDIGNFNAKQKSALNVKYGELNNTTLSGLRTSKVKYKTQMPDSKYKDLTYVQMSDEQKKRLIDRLMTDNARYAKIFVYTNDGGKYVASSSDYAILKSLGITKNVVEENEKRKLFVGFN